MKLKVSICVLLIKITIIVLGLLLYTTFLTFLSRVDTLTRDIDIAILSVRLSVCPSIRNVPVLDKMA